MKYMHDESFESRLARLDLSAVMKHVAKDTGLTEAELARAEDLYRKFLTLKAKHTDKTFVPPYVVDAVWHAHITFTRQYMLDCEMLFGEYLHHAPSEDPRNDEYFETTKSLYAQEFNLNLMTTGYSPSMLAASTCP